MKHKVQYNAKKSYYLECLVCGRAFSGTVPYEYQPVLFQFDSAVGVWELAGSSGRNWAAAGSFQNVLTLTASQICKADSKIFKACLYYITIAMLLIDPLYLSILCVFFGGGDMNGIALLFPEWAVRIFFGVMLVIHCLLFWRIVLPRYNRAFMTRGLMLRHGACGARSVFKVQDTEGTEVCFSLWLWHQADASDLYNRHKSFTRPR